MKSKKLIHSFAFILLIPTLIIFYNGLNIIIGLYKVQNWVEIDGTIISHEIKRIKSSKSTTIKLNVEYEYEWESEVYRNKKIDFSIISLNLNKQRVKKQINIIQQNKIKVWINPINPSQSIIDKSFPIEELNFTSCFIFIIGFIGIFWLFGILTNFKKSIQLEKTLSAVPFVFLMFFPVNILFYINHLGFKSIILNIVIVILCIIWYKSSLKYIKGN